MSLHLIFTLFSVLHRHIYLEKRNQVDVYLKPRLVPLQDWKHHGLREGWRLSEGTQNWDLS
jgi:hypothetical protein